MSAGHKETAGRAGVPRGEPQSSVWWSAQALGELSLPFWRNGGCGYGAPEVQGMKRGNHTKPQALIND